MGAQQSKEELLYQQVACGNVDAVRALRNEGAGLEWIDKEGRTPLILACTRGDLSNVAETLMELGANVNAYRPGIRRRHRKKVRARKSHRRFGGTPLHHAAKKGLDKTVLSLLSHGANPLIISDDCQTPLDMARERGHVHVVRAIEGYICLFCGWVRELYGPGFLGALVPQLLSRKIQTVLDSLDLHNLNLIWAVVLPCDPRNLMMPQKFELSLYSGLQDARPRTTMALWKAEIEEPKFNQSDPTLVIFDKATRTRYKFLSANEGDKQQLQRFYEACRGVRQVNMPGLAAPTAPVSAPEDLELAMAINASIQSTMQERPPLLPDTHQSQISETSNANGWGDLPNNDGFNGWGPPDRVPPPSKISDEGWMVLDSVSHSGSGGPEAGPSGTPALHAMPVEASPTHNICSVDALAPSAPPILEETAGEKGPIHYPSIDSSPIDLSVPPLEVGLSNAEQKEDNDSSLCVICWSALKEGACIPCGHMAGCMACLNEIKAKNWGCPVCRATIEHVTKIYAV